MCRGPSSPDTLLADAAKVVKDFVSRCVTPGCRVGRRDREQDAEDDAVWRTWSGVGVGEEA